MNFLRHFALEHGFEGVDWSFTAESLPRSPGQESAFSKTIADLYPLEIRYHCALRNTDLGDLHNEQAKSALDMFRRACRLVSKLGGHFLTIHVGLGRNTTTDLSWERTIARLGDLVRFADNIGVRICLENLAWGWTSRPELFEKLIRKSGCSATLDIGHARISPSVLSQQYHVEDFVVPHPERFLNAHIYHEENGEGHIPPRRLEDLEDRLRLISRLPSCNWWVLELREEKALLSALRVVREFMELEFNRSEVAELPSSS